MRSRWLDISQVLFFACLWTETNINTQKKERGQYPAILTEQAWSIKDLLYGKKHQSMICILAEQSPYPERHLARSGNQSQREIRFILPAHGVSHTINHLIFHCYHKQTSPFGQHFGNSLERPSERFKGIKL